MSARGRRSATVSGLAAAALLLGASPAPGEQRAEEGQKLPAMPSRLDRGASSECTPASTVPAKRQDWARQRLDLKKLRSRGGGAGTTVAVIDTGIAPTAGQFGGRVASGSDEGDCVGHGTFVAGLVAGGAAGDVDLGGLAPEAEVLGLRGTDAQGAPDAGRVATALDAAVAARVDVAVVSVALGKRDQRVARSVRKARAAGVFVVAAAAPDPPARTTDEPPPSRRYWPAAEPGVLSVVEMDSDGGRSENALRTPGADLAAPGVDVVADGARGKGSYLGEGASLAAGFVGGAAALVRAEHPKESPDAVARRLLATAYPGSVPQLDPYAAVTGVADGGARAAGESAPEPVTLRDTSDADDAAHRALLLGLGGGAALLVVAWAAFAVSRARGGGPRPVRPRRR